MRYSTLSRLIAAKCGRYGSNQQKVNLRNTFFLKKPVPPKAKSFGQLVVSAYGVGVNTAISACCGVGVHYGTPIASHGRFKLQGLFSSIENGVASLNKPMGANLVKLERAASKFKVKNGFVSGIRRAQHLPVRGQRTKTNARSSKGRRK